MKPLRKFLYVVSIVLLMSLLPLTSSSAAPPLDPPNPPTLPEFAQGIVASARLAEGNGLRSYAMTPVLVEAIRTGPNSVAITYEVGIPMELLAEEETGKAEIGLLDLFPFAAYAASDSHYGCDSTVSVCATLTLYYTQVSNHGHYNYTTNRWTRSDPAVTWSNAKLKAGCHANWWDGSGICNTIVTRTIGVPTSGTTYSYTPWFAGSSHEVYLTDLDGIAAYQSICLKRGTSTWSFTFCVNHQGGQVIQGCY